MPELPEVETMCRGIGAIVGRTVKSVATPTCAYRPISIVPSIRKINAKLAGSRIVDVTRLGKRVLIHSNDFALILQPKMTGLVSLGDTPGKAHVRLQVEFRGSPRIQLLFWDRRGLGTVELIPRDEIQTRIVDGRLGPDALAIKAAEFADRLAKTSRAIKVALLDQKLLAGVGNLYASEMLHVSGINPATQCNSLSKKKVERLYNAMQDILLTAIENEGSTLSDGTYRTTLNEPGSYQNQHLVYDREGMPCPSCANGVIQRTVQAQRSTFYCKKCQRG